MRVKIGSMVKFYTILLLRESPKHGYDLMKELEGKLGVRIGASQVYPFLCTLEKNRLISIKSTGERDKKVYSLTAEGRKFIGRYLERFGDLIDAAISEKLTICAHCGCKLYQGGYKEQIKGKQMVFCCHYCADAYKRSL